MISYQILQSAGHTADIRLSLKVERGMPEMPGLAEVPSEQLAFCYDRASHTGSQREKNDILNSSSGSLPDFAHQCSVGVIQNYHGTTQSVWPVQAL